MDNWQYQPAKDLHLGPQERRLSLRREVGLLSALLSLAWRLLMLLYLRLYHRLEIHGKHHLPPLPFILISNHTSHLDAIILSVALPLRYLGHIFPIAAGDTFFTQTLTRLFATTCMNALPIWRKNCGAHSLQDLRDRLQNESCAYILFPEGTRTRTGELGTFKAGIGRLVAETPVPLVPCYLHGAWEALGPHKKFPSPRKITLLIGPPIPCNQIPHTKEGWIAISQQAEQAVLTLKNSIPPS